jgi:multidrug resistance efflux pump
MSLRLYNAENNNYLEAVATIAEAKTLAERRAAINDASARKDKADDTRDDVKAANATLDAAIAKYNADVAASNNAAANTNKVAASAVGATTAPAAVEKFVAIVKKIFE